MTVYTESVAHVATQSISLVIEFNLLILEGLCEWFLFTRKAARA